ncbi:MAG: hypothetical protein GXY48_03565 [Methanomicrobiales archaeon]|nr:hypothetical protein [Methanomicrobiales archaeon]
MSDWYFPKSSPRPVKDGIKAASKRGAIGEQWWSKRFLDTLHQMGMDNRLARGRTYARKGQVMRLDISKGVVTAAVQGSVSKPYQISISISQWNEKEWKNVISAIGKQALYSAQMLAGEMPHEIEEIIEKAGTILFPKDGRDLKTNCSCPDYANPCKHIAAVYYILAEQFDKDPFLIYAMRGMGKDNLLDALRQERGMLEPEMPDEVPPIQEVTCPVVSGTGFFSMRKSLDCIDVHLTRQAEVKGGLIRSLGPSPGKVGKNDVADLIAKAYVIAPEYVSQLVHGNLEKDSLDEKD